MPLLSQVQINANCQKFAKYRKRKMKHIAPFQYIENGTFQLFSLYPLAGIKKDEK